ncbi:hypothetical protein [EBPR siphovirus 5]|nr:hypothetical protein [EBPR siphovirus 5]
MTVGNLKPYPKTADWHAPQHMDEPLCSADQWRTRDRMVVLYVSEMEDRHLRHCIRFASTKPQHRSRLGELLAEAERRKNPAKAGASAG